MPAYFSEHLYCPVMSLRQTQRDRHRETDTETDTERQTQRQTQRDRHRGGCAGLLLRALVLPSHVAEADTGVVAAVVPVLVLVVVTAVVQAA